jgi:type I restriction enzyme S subunit
MDDKDQLQYQRYRDSKVRGLDHLPAHWEEERAKHYFQPVDERSETGEEQLLSVSEKRGIEPRDDEKVHMRKAESYEGYKLCQPGDLVINSMWAWKRGLGISEHSGIISTAYSVFRLRDPSLFEEKYLDWLLRTDLYVGEYLCRSQGVWKSRLTLSDREFLDIPIIRPPIEDQRAIVDHLEDTLDDIDAYVAKKRELVDLLETQRRAVVNRAVTKGLDDDVEMRDSGVEWLGEIPAHWDTVQLGRVWDIIDCKHRTATYVDEGIPIVNPTQVKPGGLDLEGAERTTEEEFEDLTSGGRRPRKGDIIYSRNASVGAAAYVDTEERFCMGQDVCIIRSSDQDQRFLAYQLNSSSVLNQLEVVMVGATFKRINVSAIRKLRVTLPPLDEQKRIVEHIDAQTADIDAAIERTERQIDLMQQYRTSLVTEVVTGAVDVWAEVAA